MYFLSAVTPNLNTVELDFVLRGVNCILFFKKVKLLHLKVSRGDCSLPWLWCRDYT